LPIGVLFAFVGYFIQIRMPKRRLWQVNDPSHLVVCSAASTKTNTGVYHRPSTGIGQVRALTLATRSLNQAYSKKLDVQNILLSDDNFQERIENDLLILGGPKNNRVAAKFLDLLYNEQPAMVIDSSIIWRTNQVRQRWVDQGAIAYEGKAVNRKITTDYGLIIRTQSPFTSRNSTGILFAGSHTYGTVAAAKFFTEDLHKHLRKLTRDGRKNFVVLVSTNIMDGYPTSMKVERSYAW
jgi:hypothetical protein